MIERYLTDVIGEVVQTTSIALNKHILFEFGDVNEIVSTLSEMSKYEQSTQKKYPLIMLFTDITEGRGNETHIQSDATIPSIVIATFSSKDYKAKERMDKSVKGILNPIYDEFLKQIKLHPDILTMHEILIPHDKIIRLSWGKSAIFNLTNVGSDFIDAIEIKNLKLKILTKIC